jgi:hypothetical protein
MSSSKGWLSALSTTAPVPSCPEGFDGFHFLSSLSKRFLAAAQ